MKTRIARWPLAFLVLFGAAAAAGAFILPGLDPALTVAGIAVVANADLITLGLTGLALIFGSLSWLLRKQVPTAAPAAPAPAAQSAYGAEPPAAGTRAERRAAEKARTKVKMTKDEKRRAAEDEKFRKQAEKEAAAAAKKAAKAAKRGKALVAETAVNTGPTAADEPGADSLANSILAAGGDPQATKYSEEDGDRANGVVYELDTYLPPAAIAAVMEATQPTLPAEPTAPLPDWVSAAYADPTFQVPFTPQQTVAEPSFDQVVAEPVAEQGFDQPVAEPVVEPVAEPIAEPVAEPSFDQVIAEPVVEPVAELRDYDALTYAALTADAEEEAMNAEVALRPGSAVVLDGPEDDDAALRARNAALTIAEALLRIQADTTSASEQRLRDELNARSDDLSAQLDELKTMIADLSAAQNPTRRGRRRRGR